MSRIDRRDFLKVMGLGAAAGAAPIVAKHALAGTSMPEKFYDLPMKGNVRLLHITDVHGQLKPVYFREPNVNLGVGEAYGRPPHLVGLGGAAGHGVVHVHDLRERAHPIVEAG